MLGGNAAISDTDTSRTSTTSTKKSAIRTRRKLRLLCRSENWMSVVQRATEKPAGSIFIFNFAMANELELMETYIIWEMVVISVSWKEFQKIDGRRRQYTHKHCTYSAVQSVHKRGTHTQRAWLKNCIVIFVRLKRFCHLVLHMSHPLLFSHLPFRTSTSSSSFTLPSTTTQEHKGHPVHHAYLQARPVDKLRLQESLWRENLQSGAGEPVFLHRWKHGAQGWCGPGVCVLSEEPNPGRNETVWVHMRNCLHKCNRTQVSPATNEEAEGIETVTSLLPSLSEAVREGRTRHFADITDEEILRTMSEKLWKAMSWTFALEDQIRSQNLSSTHLPLPTPHHAAPLQKPTRSPRPRSRLQLALTWRLEPVIAGFDFEKREIHRDTIWTHPRTGSRRWKRVGKRQDELRQVNPLSLFILSKQARPSSPRWVQLLQLTTQLESDFTWAWPRKDLRETTKWRCNVTDTDDGCRPEEKERWTSRRQGRRDEASTSGKARNTEPFRLRRPRRAHCMDNFISVDVMSARYLGTTLLPESKCQRKTTWTGDLLSPCSALEGETPDTMPRPDGACAVSRILTSTRLSAVAQRQSCGVDYFRRDVGRRGEGIHARWSECSRWTTVRHSASRTVARCTWGSTDPTGPRGVWAGQWHLGVAITNCLPIERGRLRDERVWTLLVQ